MSAQSDRISFRLLTAADVGVVPIGHQGDSDEVLQRIADLGASAMLAFDGDQHVGQLQFRRYEPNVPSPKGLWDPLYWADFASHAPDLPARTLAVFCYHVGQLDDTDARDPRYQGRGLGLSLLDHFLDWALQAGFAAVVAKAVPPYRPVKIFMGGQPASVYQARGFETVADWVDHELRAIVTDRELTPDGVDPDDAARVSCCVRRLRYDSRGSAISRVRTAAVSVADSAVRIHRPRAGLVQIGWCYPSNALARSVLLFATIKT